MMEINIKANNGNEYSKSWTVNEPNSPLMNHEFYGVTDIIVNGPELDYVKKLFMDKVLTTVTTNRTYSIPMPNQETVWWWGETAKTIVSNLVKF